MKEKEIITSKVRSYFKGSNSIEIKSIEVEDEGREYMACKLETIKGKSIFRKAKITPKKVGMFVTLWQRVDKVTIPYTSDDNFNSVVILCIQGDRKGYFLFSKDVLVDKGIVSSQKSRGKNGFRVYPPWVVTESKTAEKTQKWQVENFYGIS